MVFPPQCVVSVCDVTIKNVDNQGLREIRWHEKAPAGARVDDILLLVFLPMWSQLPDVPATDISPARR